MELNMLDEKHHNQIDLKNRLEELSALPGETAMDKDLAWDKLYMRLHKKPKHRINGWYWTAAACVLLTIFLLRIIGLNKEKNLVKNNSENTQIHSAMALQQPVKETNPMEAEMPVAKNKRTIQTNIQSAHKNPNSLLTRNGNSRHQLNDVPLSVRNSDQMPIQPPLQPNPVLVLNTAATAKAVPSISKKKLRVVHVNELDEPAEEDYTLVKNSGRHAFRIKWTEQHVPLNTSIETDHSGYAILKINLSSPN